MIYTLPLTIFVESMVVLVYCAIQKRSAGALLQASLIVNVFTQVLLWLALRMFFRYYMVTLITAEVLICPVEGLFLYWLPGDNLKLSQAMILSLCMNAASFGVGWFLPV